MKDEKKTKAQLIDELNELRQQVAEFDARAQERTQSKGLLWINDKDYTLLADSLFDGIYEFDLERRITYANEACIDMFGYTKDEELRGIKVQDLICEDDNDISIEDVIDILRGMVITGERTFIRKDGTRFTGEVHSGPVYNEGRVVAIRGILRDITERKQAEEGLRESEEKWRSSFNSLEDVMLIIDRDYYIENINDNGLALLGKSRKEVVGHKCYEIIHNEEKPGEFCPCIKALETKDVEFVERYEEAFGKHFSIKSSPILDENGRIIRFVDLIRDITNQKQTEEALQVKNSAIESSVNAVAIADLEGNLSYVNPAFLKLWGYDDDQDVLGKSAITFWLMEEKAVEVMESLISMGGWVGELVALRRDGSSFNVQLSASMVESEIGEPICMMSSFLDITERKQAEEVLKKQSITDELTGLFNRYHFYATLEQKVDRMQQYGGIMALLILDLDDFKSYNDSFGHINGDRVLQEFARTLQLVLRKSDMGFRYGGDEFVALLPSTSANDARKTVERLIKEWQQTVARRFSATQAPLMFSTGIAQCPEDGESPDSLMFLADSALFFAKKTKGFSITKVSELDACSTEEDGIARMDQVYALIATVEAKDPYTYGHSMRVALLTEVLGKSYRLSEEDMLCLQSASLLHDIGKVGIPDHILSKPGELTETECMLIRKHSIEGARIVDHVRDLKSLVPLILHHHEWFDGNGYPDGIKGDMIPVGARMLAIADAYDTMTSDCLYRNKLSHEKAIEELRKCSGTKFDPDLVRIFSEVMNDATRQKIFERSHQFNKFP